MSKKDVMDRALQRVAASATAMNLTETLEQNATTPPIVATAPGAETTDNRLQCLATGHGLSTTPVCTSVQKLTHVICALISEKLGFEEEAQIKLGKELDAYFAVLGIHSDDIFGFYPLRLGIPPLPRKKVESQSSRYL